MIEPGDGASTNERGPPVETPVVETDQIRLLQWCIEFISRYRAGAIPKIRAINEIFNIIFESELDEEEQDQITGHFLGLIKETEQSFAGSGRLTSEPMVDGSNGQHGPGLGNTERNNETDRPDQSTLDRARDSFLQPGPGDASLVDMNERAPVDELNDELDYRRKPQVNVAKLPWQSQVIEKSIINNPILRETQQQLALFSQDMKTVLNNLQVATDKPPFPSSEWENIIFRYPINLNKVYMSASTGQFDSRQLSSSKEDGTMQASEETGKVKRLVSNAGSWIIVWNVTRQAISFVSRHRQVELQRYGDHIMSLFAIHQGRDFSIIEYDRVVREEQCAQNAWTLQDFSRFSHFQLAIISSSRQTEFGPSRVERSNKRSHSSEICNNFNSGVCPRTKVTCYHRHICSTC